MTEGALFVTGGILLAGAYVAQVLDYIMTVKGLDRGMAEIGLVNRLFIKSKADEGKLPVITIVEAAIVTVLAGVFGVHGGAYLVAFAAPVLVAETINDIRSAKLLKIF